MKSNLALAVIFAVLTGLSAWKLVANATEYMDLETSPTMFDGFRAETVATIKVIRQKRDGSKDAQGNAAIEGLAFVKQEGKWVIADPDSPFMGVPVMSSQVVSDILERVGRIKVTDSNVISVNADDLELEEKEVNTEAGMRIQCTDANGQVLADLIVGRAAGKKIQGLNEAVEGTFVLKEGTKQIVLFEEAFALDLDPKTWIDKTRRDVSTDEVTEIEIQGEAEGKKIDVHFKRDGNKGWKAVKTPADLGPLKGFDVDEIIRAASRVDAIEIIAPLNPADLQKYGLAPKARLHVIIKTKDDKTLDLYVGKRVEGKQDFYAYIGGQLLFSLAEWDVKRYEKEAKDYFDPKPVEIKESGDEKDGDEKDGVKKPGDEKDGVKKPDDEKPGVKKDEAQKAEGQKPGDGKPGDPDPGDAKTGEPTPGSKKAPSKGADGKKGAGAKD